jgi:ubiquinone/menaquinone biosynthesis C-methylase UbiE
MSFGMTTSDCSLQVLGAVLFYSATPAIVVDQNALVVDFNVAMEALAGDVLNGRRHSPLKELLGVLQMNIVEGVFYSNDRRTANCVFRAPHLGRIHMKGREMIFHSSVTAQLLGRMLLWRIVALDDCDRFHAHYRQLLGHQLTWDTYALSYDRILPLMPYYQEVLGRHLRVLGMAPEGPIIDLGAGTGNLVEKLLHKGRSVTAIDSSRAMLDRLRDKIAAAPEVGKRLTMFEARAEALPMIRDASYAGASLQLALFDMENPGEGLATAIRVLQPGGRIIITDLKRTFSLAPILKECHERLRALGRHEELAADLARVVHSNEDLRPGSSLFHIEDVFDTLARCGFEELTMQDSHLNQCATVTGKKPTRCG